MRTLKYIIILILLSPVAGWADSVGVTYDSTYFTDTYLNGASGEEGTKCIDSPTIWVATYAGYRHPVFHLTNAIWNAVGVGYSVDSIVCSLYCTYNFGSPTVNVYNILKVDIDMPNATWNDWDAPAREWAVAGADSANDAETYNTGDGDEADRWATEFTSFIPNATSTWFTYTIDDADWLNDNYVDTRGLTWMLRIEAATKMVQFASLDYGTAASRPKSWLYFHVPTGGANVIFIGED